MRPRTLGVLLVLVALLAAFVWLYERSLPSSDESEELGRRVLRLDPDAVRELTVTTAAGTAVLARSDSENEGWRLVEPFDHPADGNAVADLLEALSELEHSRALDEWEPAAVGLDAPRGRVELVDAAGPTTLEVGAEVPASDTMIVALAGSSRALVVPRLLWTRLDRGPGDWRSREVIPGGGPDVRSVRIEAGGSAVRLERTAAGFEVVEPYRDLADTALVDDLVADLVATEVATFPDEMGEEPDPGFGSAGSLRLTVETAAGTTLELEIGDEATASDRRYARLDGGRTFVVDRGFAGVAARLPEDWRSRDWSPVAPYQVAAVTLVTEDLELELAKEGRDWRHADGKAADLTAVSELLYALDEARAEGFSPAPAPAPAAAAAVLEVRLATTDEREIRLAAHAPDADGRHPATVTGRDAVLLLAGAAVDRVVTAARALGE
ncbi:MAG: DUF4340 domain-containing protein [Thermoanaerobaculia bacterium]|nr:DUF4340 domain-containing protein [Thermoanaerobaculia bacterium]